MNLVIEGIYDKEEVAQYFTNFNIKKYSDENSYFWNLSQKDNILYIGSHLLNNAFQRDKLLAENCLLTNKPRTCIVYLLPILLRNSLDVLLLESYQQALRKTSLEVITIELPWNHKEYQKVLKLNWNLYGNI